MKEMIKKMFSGDNKIRIIWSLILGTLSAFLIFYIFLPPINLQAVGFWVYLTVVIAIYSLPFIDFRFSNGAVNNKKKKNAVPRFSFKLDIGNKWALVPTAIPVFVIIVGMFLSSEVLFARKYAGIISVNESNFSEDLPETTEITNIALMDTESAKMLGNRTLGSLSSVVSQYTVSTEYTQINYKNTPKKVANLEYDGFFKWIGNKHNGIPGIVVVDPVNSSAEYMKLDKPMYYVESAYFGEDLMRKLRFDYPTKIFDSSAISFEIDDDGNPYYIISCFRPQVMLFGARDVEEVIIFDPTDGSSALYDVKDTPSWVDIVYDGYLACEKYNWHGTLSGGFLNSIIGNVGCKIATDDFGYVVLEDDVWYFTGVTSAVSDDKSNIGFILTNARTGEYKFYPVIGAEEHSAMAAAEGEVQEKGYVASFPSLVNISGQATYIMVLKDDAGLVKLYALVNVENYSIVATGATQTDAMSAYKKLLRQSNINIGENDAVTEITVKDVEIVMVSGVATVYIKADNGNVYKGYLEADEALILVEAGDRLKVSYSESDIKQIFIISNWEFLE